MLNLQLTKGQVPYGDMKRQLSDAEKLEKIAEGTHNALMRFCQMTGDWGLTDWEDASEKQQEDTRKMVKNFLEGGLLPRAEHERWYADKVNAGYKYGPVRNDDETKPGGKTNPSLVLWENLPVLARMKNIYLPVIVFALAAHYGLQVKKVPDLVYG